jgi:alkylation response protein AidB-like acyl-CoA dehydrogenase
VRFCFTEEEESFRQEVQSFLDKELPDKEAMYVINPAEDYFQDGIWELHRSMARKFAEKGWLTVGWPPEYGGTREVSLMCSGIFQEEIRYRGAPGWDACGVAMVAPLLIRLGTEQQKREHLPYIARGERFWCQGFSEPDAGSDLASVQTSAREDDSGFIVNGSKIWTSGAHRTDWCHFLARTDPNAEKKTGGITYFLVDMKTPGISVRPIEHIGGGQGLCEVFFDNVRVPAENVVGEKNRGWQAAMMLLEFERGLGVGAIGTMRRFLDMILYYLKEQGMENDRLVRQYLADMVIYIETARLLSYKVLWLASQGLPVHAQVSMSKPFTAEAQQRLANTAMKILGSFGQLVENSHRAPLRGLLQRWYLESFAFTIFGGTSEIQRNILATMGLGLPRN